MNTPKKRVGLTVEERLEILRLHKSGQKQVQIAKKYNISPSTVSKIIKKPKKLENECISKPNLQRKRLRFSTNGQVLDYELYMFYCSLIINNANVTDKMLIAQSALITSGAQEMSSQQLQRWKRRHEIKLKKQVAYSSLTSSPLSLNDSETDLETPLTSPEYILPPTPISPEDHLNLSDNVCSSDDDPTGLPTINSRLHDNASLKNNAICSSTLSKNKLHESDQINTIDESEIRQVEEWIKEFENEREKQSTSAMNEEDSNGSFSFKSYLKLDLNIDHDEQMTANYLKDFCE
jgi:DNA-binding Lrp family transcriptional regulator